MKIRGNGSAVAVVVSVVAVVLASGGTAVAVTLAKTTVVDPTTPSHAARVDSSGHLSVADSPSTIDSSGYVYGFTDRSTTIVSSPTTATLAISRISVSNPSANAAAAEQQLSLGKYPVNSDGSCNTAGTPVPVARYNAAAGDDIVDTLSAPLVVKPTGTAKYCLAFAVTYIGTSTATPPYYLVYGLAAYVTYGTYTGIGLGTAAVQQPASAKISR